MEEACSAPTTTWTCAKEEILLLLCEHTYRNDVKQSKATSSTKYTKERKARNKLILIKECNEAI